MKQNTHGLWDNLQATLTTDLANTAELVSLLERERKALETRDYADFEQIISPKKHLLEQIEQQADIRQQLLHQAGFTDESTTLIEAKEHAPAVADDWHALAKLWRSCQHLNETNELIAKRKHRVVGQILDVIRGKNQQTRLYTSKGNAQTSASSRSITSA